MVFDFSALKSKVNQKLLIQIYFIFFILLNIIDFLNIIPNDLDFFKKILSWSLIGYIFYKVSITKILIGKRVRSYDLGFILAFSLISLVKSLGLYLFPYVRNGSTKVLSQDFPIFHYLLEFLPHSTNQVSVYSAAGLVITLVLLISLIVNFKIEKESFLGSFNFKNEYFRNLFNYIFGYIFLVFFSLIIFNFFMEWFALAVDSVILVFGILYYLFVYISNHMTNKVSTVLSDISNSGNEFYYNLIEKFSDKRTFFIGVSFLLAIHFLVDIGVYFVPYLFGTQNALYFESLSEFGRGHLSLFSIFNFENSLLYMDLLEISGDWMFDLGIILIYISSYLFFLILMIMPFYIFYQNVKRKSFTFRKWFGILFLTLLFLNSTLFFLTKIDLPLNMDVPNVLSVKGVDFHTNLISDSLKFNDSLLVSVLIFLTIFLFIIFRYDKYKFFFDKLILISILIFFSYYIFLFFTSSIQDDFSKLENDISNKFEWIGLEDNFQEINEFRLNKTTFRKSHRFKNEIGMDIKMDVFSDIDIENKNLSHNDYLYFEFSQIPYNEYVLVLNSLDNFYFEDYSSIKITKNFNKTRNQTYYATYFLKDKGINLIYSLGKDKLRISDSNRFYDSQLSSIVNNLLVLQKIDFVVNDEVKNDSYLDKVILFMAYLKILFSGMFYIFGSLAFVWYFIKKNLFNLNG